jgi:chorismate mutase/prephenate dehydratase
MNRKPASNNQPARGSKERRISSKPADPKRPPTLGALRGEIDKLDQSLVGLLNRRAEIATLIGQIKHDQGIEVWSAAREDEVVSKALAASAGPLPPETLRIIFRELMSGSRSLQRAIHVAYLGPKYSYSHLAAVAKFGEAAIHVPVGSIAAVFEDVNRRHVEFGLVPLENSTDGRVADTLDMFVKLPNIMIRAEVRLRIHHCLLGRSDWSQIRRVYSKSQALSQCRNWLGKNLPQATKVEVVSTAAAAELAQREDFAAAVASRAAASGYHLNVLAENIEDQPHNVTRFAVIGDRAEERTGRDKTALMIRLPNQAGSLTRTISPFEKLGVNMTWIESFPIPGPIVKGDDTNPSYLFFIDVEGHQSDPPIRQAIETIRKRCERIDIIGSYPRSVCIET